MSITEISVKRPAAITMVIVLLIGLGIFGYKSMGADLLPAMDIPVITISTSYSGAGAEDIKQDIVEPIENAVSGISGIDTLTSRSKAGVGTVILRFTVGSDMNSALLDVQKAVDTVTKNLPKDASNPVIYKVNTDDQPVLTLALSGSDSYEELYNQASNIQTDLENLPGIAQVSLQGVDQRQLFVKLDKTKIEYYGINVTALMAELQNNNINMPAGLIKQDKLSESIRVVGDYANIDEIKNLSVPTNLGSKVRLVDIADVKLDYPDPTSITKLNGKKTVAITIQKQSDANVVEVVNSVKVEMGRIKKAMPKGMNVVVANDTTVFITQSLTQIKENLIEGIITTAIVLLFFLKSWRSSLVVLVAIPTSLISTFFMMYELHFTLNMMSLMGLALCIGILVDDSIVVLENIQRHLSMGKSPVRAAIEGRKEIGMAAVAITLCDVVVFAPIALMPGSQVSLMFRQFALTIVFATLFSLFVSFTVTPMLASKIFNGKVETKKKLLPKKNLNVFVKAMASVAKFMEKFTKLYSNILIWSLENRIKVLITISLLVALSVSLLPLNMIKSEFMPSSDQGSITLSMSLSPSSTLQQTDAKIVQVEKYLQTIPEISEYFTTVGNGSDITSGQISIQLVPKADRKKSQSAIASQIRSWGRRITGANFGVTETSQMGGGRGSKPIDIDISGPDDKVLKAISFEVENLVSSVPGVADVSNTARADQDEFRVNIDRLAASQYGISIADISSALRTAISGSQAGVYRSGDNVSDEYNVTVKFMDNQIKSPTDIGSIKVQSSSGIPIPLSQVATIIQTDGAKTISRQSRQDVVTIGGNTEQGVALGTVTDGIKNKLAATTFPLGYKVSYSGSQKQMADTFSVLAKALGVSLILIYMILVVLYESYITPFLRLLALPCALIGALGILAITGKTLNMMSVIGLIMLDGLASKNGTLLIDYTNTLMKSGMNLKEALITSGKTRLRPIIMTSTTMVVGMLSSALAIGEGSETKSSMSCVIIGGMITSTLLSPILIPVAYTLIDDFQQWFSKKFKNKSNSTEVEQYEV